MALRFPTKGRWPEGGCSSPSFLGQSDSLCAGATGSSNPQRAWGHVQRERGSVVFFFCLFLFFIVNLLENAVRSCMLFAGGGDVAIPFFFFPVDSSWPDFS